MMMISVAVTVAVTVAIAVALGVVVRDLDIPSAAGSTTGELARAADGMGDIELVEVNHASAVGFSEQNVGKAVVPLDVFGGKGVAGVDGLGQRFIKASEGDDDFSAIASQSRYRISI